MPHDQHDGGPQHGSTEHADLLALGGHSLEPALKAKAEQFITTLDKQLGARLRYVQHFRVSASWARLTTWDPLTKAMLAGRLLDNLRKVVNGARFYYESQLSLTMTEDSIRAEYEDDLFAFAVQISPDGMELWKNGLDSAGFALWIFQIRDSIESVFNTVITAINDIFKKEIEFSFVDFEIRFLLFDFVDINTGKSTNHAVIMTRLIKQFPDSEGKLADHDQGNLDNIARIDYNVHGWINEGEKARRVIYRVEAPANRNRSTLWFTFAFSGMSYTSPNGSRFKCRPAEVLGETDEFFDFVKDKAISSFMQSLLDGYSFSTGVRV